MTGEELIVFTADNLPVRVDQVASRMAVLRIEELDLDDVFYEETQTGHGEIALV